MWRKNIVPDNIPNFSAEHRKNLLKELTREKSFLEVVDEASKNSKWYQDYWKVSDKEIAKYNNRDNKKKLKPGSVEELLERVEGEDEITQEYIHLKTEALAKCSDKENYFEYMKQMVDDCLDYLRRLDK